MAISDVNNIELERLPYLGPKLYEYLISIGINTTKKLFDLITNELVVFDYISNSYIESKYRNIGDIPAFKNFVKENGSRGYFRWKKLAIEWILNNYQD